MDWTKLNMKEVVYFCKSNEIDFCCEPFSLQIEELILMFHYYGIKQFTVRDIQELYDKMQIPKLKSEGVLRPIPSKIRKVMEQMQNVKCIDENTFEIVQAEKGHFLPFDVKFYFNEIEKGYRTGIAKNRIEGYYEKYGNILKL
ncbi:MAG: hypothetical protein NC427_11790 [Ruminococcus flavefaciens]|nr:hypothetical protein [Ruminococcus flavefaciens]